jgi:uncharacterized protein (UPF0335 family)
MLSVVGGAVDGKDSGASGATGRKGRDGQEAVTRPDVVRDAMSELEGLLKASQEADAKLNDAIKKVAQSSGYMASAIKKLVKARVGDSFSDKKRDAEQQLELFSEVGQLS